MNIFIWVVAIGILSFLWAFLALKKEKNKKELNEAQRDISKGRVIFHSSDSSESSSS